MSERLLTSQQLSQAVARACWLEASARKLGNVHPQASFADATWQDFVRSGQLIAAVLGQPDVTAVAPSMAAKGDEHAANAQLGSAIFRCVSATVEEVGHNTNLGIVLLLAPLVAAAKRLPAGLSSAGVSPALAAAVQQVLAEATVADTQAVYRAIRLAKPAGLGRSAQADLSEVPVETLTTVMGYAADRDDIASQYVCGFAGVKVFADLLTEVTTPFFSSSVWPVASDLWPGAAARTSVPVWERAILDLQLQMLSRFPDTLIARKLGLAAAEDVQLRAVEIIQAGWPTTDRSWWAWRGLDRFLRDDKHQRNPGTTADMIAAALCWTLCDPQSPWWGLSDDAALGERPA